jgi:hypothetical protein
MAAILLRCSWSHVHILQLWIFSFWWYLDYVDLSFHGRMWSYHVVTSCIFTLSIFPLNIWLFFVGMTYFIRKRSFSACAKICWKLAGFYTKFGKKKTLEQFFDWHTQHEKHNNIFVSWIFFLCSDRSKGYWICTIFAWLSYHSELFICKSVVGKGKVSRIIYLCPASVWCKSMICSYCWNINGCRADRHMPTYAKKIVDMYNKNGEIEKMLSEKWF